MNEKKILTDPFTLFKLFVSIIFVIRDFLYFHATDYKLKIIKNNIIKQSN